MKWSTRIGRFAGIDVYVHATFLMLIAWVAYAHWQTGHSVRAAAAGVAFVLALFGCVVLHEFGHALTARRFGIRTRDITLLLIGGLARLERMPDDPRQEPWSQPRALRSTWRSLWCCSGCCRRPIRWLPSTR